jgi:hypothetical protein
MDIQEILDKTPEGKIAMFTVVSIMSGVEDRVLGMTVYVHREKIYDCMSDTEIPGLRAEDLRFDGYIWR